MDRKKEIIEALNLILTSDANGIDTHDLGNRGIGELIQRYALGDYNRWSGWSVSHQGRLLLTLIN